MEIFPALARRFVCPLGLLLISSTRSQAGDVSWQLNVANPPNHFRWSTAQNWNPTGVPGMADNVFVNANAGPELDINTTIANLTVQRGVIDTVTTGGAALTVTGTTTVQPPVTFGGSGIYAESGATYTLGTLTNFSGGVLHGTADTEYFANGPNAPATIQFKGAHVIETEATLYVQGGGRFLDQDTGLNALRDLAVNRADIYITYAGALSVSGSFTNQVAGAIYMGARGATDSTFTVPGDFTNATANTGLYIDSPATVTIAGNVTNYGFISLQDRDPAVGTHLTIGGNLINKNTGGLALNGAATLKVNGQVLFESQSGMDLGGQPNVNTLYTTKLEVKNGIEFRGAYLTGIGTIFADLIFTQGGSVFRPGHSPGLVTLNGSLTFSAPTQLQMEIGGHTPGTEYDQVVQQSTGSGGVTLNGTLALSFVNGFETSIQPTDVFTILTSDLPLTGAFTNVANGARVAAADGSGSFRVDYSGNNVSVTQFQVAPPPTITSIPVSAPVYSQISVLGNGLLGAISAQVNGVGAYGVSSVSDTEVILNVPGGATSGPITLVTNHGTVVSSSILTVLADSDFDGMSDDFEQLYFGSPTGGDANTDSDGDGVSNVNEFRAGTNPTDATSRLAVTRIRRQGNDVVISFPSVVDKRYRLQASASLTSPAWTDLAILPALGSSGPRDATDLNGASLAERFYRIAVIQ